MTDEAGGRQATIACDPAEANGFQERVPAKHGRGRDVGSEPPGDDPLAQVIRVWRGRNKEASKEGIKWTA